MSTLDILTAQILDPFRIGLIVALLVTTARTRTVTGTALPLIFGLVFVALIIPLTTGGLPGTPLWRLVASGLLANAVLLAAALGLVKLFTRSSG